MNNVSNGGGGSGLAAGAVGFGIGMLAGTAASAPRPAANTVVVAPPATSVIVTRPATPVVVTPARPQVVVTQPAPQVVVTQPVPPDALAEALKMLNGRSYRTRRDGAQLLGRLKSPSAVGPLMDKLRNDKADEVRKAAAWALAEIGDATALDYLEKAAQFDDSAEVRAAARTAQQRLLSRIAVSSTVPAVMPELADAALPSSTPVPPPAPRPGPSQAISSEKPARAGSYETPRFVAPSVGTGATQSTIEPAVSPTLGSPFASSPSSGPEPPLELSPPVQPLDLP